MIVVRKYTLIAPLSLSIALLVTGCGENKASQCQRLITVVNQGTSLIDNNKGQQVTTSIQLSKDLATVTKSLEELKLSDPKLQEFQSSFVKVFQNLSGAIAKAATALNTAKVAEPTPSGRQKIQQARTEINSALTAAKNAAKESDTLEDQLNKYCTATK
jgi:chromosome segregation ATPase